VEAAPAEVDESSTCLSREVGAVRTSFSFTRVSPCLFLLLFQLAFWQRKLEHFLQRVCTSEKACLLESGVILVY
jgi:hypothetical protein